MLAKSREFLQSLATVSPHDDHQLLGALLDVTECLVIGLDREARVVMFNRACQELSGFDFEEVENRSVFERLVAPDEADHVRGVFASLRAGAERSEHEGTWVTRDGKRRLIHWRNRTVAATDDDAGYVIGTGIDVTDTRDFQARLAEREARLRAVLDTAVDGIITIDDAGVIETANAAAGEMFGYAESELVGENVSVLMPSPYREAHDDYIRRYLETGEPRIIGIGREVEGRRRDGSTFPVELAVSEVASTGRRTFTGIVRDISDRQAADARARLRLEELAHASRLLELGEMTTGIAHEVNQPLAAIVSFADACLRMVRGGNHRPQVLEDALGQISAQGNRAGEIIARLREFARKGTTAHEPMDLEDAILDVLRIIEHEVRRADVRVELDLAGDLPAVLADRIQVEQVLVNLIRNAVEAMAMDSGAMDRGAMDRGAVDAGVAGARAVETPAADARDHRVLGVATRPLPPDRIEVSVTDTGHGFDPDSEQQVFETFYTTKPGGLGVGLAISRSIVEAHGGHLEASPNQPRGARFRFSLPKATTASGDA